MEKNLNTIKAEEWLANVKQLDDTEHDPLITYFFINKSLDMSSGKIAVQSARAGQVMLLNEIDKEDTLLLSSLNELFQDEFMHGNKSIALKANGSQMNRLLSGDLKDKLDIISEESNLPIRLYPVYDIGATEVATNSLTVIAMTPIYKSIINKFARKFQTY